MNFNFHLNFSKLVKNTDKDNVQQAKNDILNYLLVGTTL